MDKTHIITKNGVIAKKQFPYYHFQMMKHNQKINTCFLIKLIGMTLMKNLTICEFCKKYAITQSFHCNYCIKKQFLNRWVCFCNLWLLRIVDWLCSCTFTRNIDFWFFKTNFILTLFNARFSVRCSLLIFVCSF